MGEMIWVAKGFKITIMHTFAMVIDWFTLCAGAYWLLVIGVFTWVVWCIERMRR